MENNQEPRKIVLYNNSIDIQTAYGLKICLTSNELNMEELLAAAEWIRDNFFSQNSNQKGGKYVG